MNAHEALEYAGRSARSSLAGFDDAVKRVEEKKRLDSVAGRLRSSVKGEPVIYTTLEAWLLGEYSGDFV